LLLDIGELAFGVERIAGVLLRRRNPAASCWMADYGVKVGQQQLQTRWKSTYRRATSATVRCVDGPADMAVSVPCGGQVALTDGLSDTATPKTADSYCIIDR